MANLTVSHGGQSCTTFGGHKPPKRRLEDSASGRLHKEPVLQDYMVGVTKETGGIFEFREDPWVTEGDSKQVVVCQKKKEN